MVQPGSRMNGHHYHQQHHHNHPSPPLVHPDNHTSRGGGPKPGCYPVGADGAAPSSSSVMLVAKSAFEESHSDDHSDSSEDESGHGGAAEYRGGSRRSSVKKKGGSGTAIRESSELEKRLKKNAREQKRASKINDQIDIMKGILEVSTDDTDKTMHHHFRFCLIGCASLLHPFT